MSFESNLHFPQEQEMICLPLNIYSRKKEYLQTICIEIPGCMLPFSTEEKKKIGNYIQNYPYVYGVQDHLYLGIQCFEERENFEKIIEAMREMQRNSPVYAIDFEDRYKVNPEDYRIPKEQLEANIRVKNYGDIRYAWLDSEFYLEEYDDAKKYYRFLISAEFPTCSALFDFLALKEYAKSWKPILLNMLKTMEIVDAEGYYL
ncbi:hypothetical protein FACS189418_7630 [Clostridia bacterium]|nr:hypothetical protein FACS189418_7630 [Clostridia bacterium]